MITVWVILSSSAAGSSRYCVALSSMAIGPLSIVVAAELGKHLTYLAAAKSHSGILCSDFLLSNAFVILTSWSLSEAPFLGFHYKVPSLSK